MGEPRDLLLEDFRRHAAPPPFREDMSGSPAYYLAHQYDEPAESPHLLADAVA